MVKVLYGKKGAGKTKVLIDTANERVAKSKGDVVFIDDSNNLMYDLKHEIRFINVSEYPVDNAPGFLGFLCGILSQDYDIEGIFIDGLTYILKQGIEELQEFFRHIEEFSARFGIDFYISINGDPAAMPDFIKEYVA